MKLGRRFGAPAAVIVVGALFLFALARVLERRAEEVLGGREVLVIAHSNLESGLREAFDSLIQEYERLHPGVRIRQIPVPGRIYPTWGVTRLVGDMAPDLMQIGGNINDTYLARYFRPLRDVMPEPNPYNAGSPLEGMPWRQTFVDGLDWPPAYSLGMFEVFGAPLAVITNRIYYNRDLLREITGSDSTPRTFGEFVALCDQVGDWSRRTGRPVVGIATSRWNAPQLLNRLFVGQTQELALRMDRLDQLMLFMHDKNEQFFLGQWRLDEPELRSALSAVSRVATAMPAGFSQLEREDATFLFCQGRALMIVASSQDVNSLESQSAFEIGAFALPLPSPGEGEFGRYPLGPISEGLGGTNIALGVTLNGRHQTRAIDFLHFMTSYDRMATFTRLSNWLPLVIGVPPPDRMRIFLPDPQGLTPGLHDGTTWGGDEDRTFYNHLHLLLPPTGSVDRFLAEFEAPYRETIRRIRDQGMRDQRRGLQTGDTTLLAYAWLSEHDPDPQERETAAYKLGLLLDNDAEAEAHLHWEESFQDPEFIKSPRDLPFLEALREDQILGEPDHGKRDLTHGP